MYYYLQTPQSASRKAPDEFWIRSRLYVMPAVMNFCKEKNLKENCSRMRVGQMWVCIEVLKVVWKVPAYKKYYKQCLRIMKQLAREWDSDQFSRKLYRYMIRGLRISPELTVHAYMFLKKIPFLHL